MYQCVMVCRKRFRVVTFRGKVYYFWTEFPWKRLFVRINAFLLLFRNMFFPVSQACGNTLSPGLLLEAGGLCVLCRAAWLSCSEPGIKRQRSEVPCSFSRSDGQGVHLSLPPAVLEIPPLPMVTKVTELGWIL